MRCALWEFHNPFRTACDEENGRSWSEESGCNADSEYRKFVQICGSFAIQCSEYRG